MWYRNQMGKSSRSVLLWSLWVAFYSALESPLYSMVCQPDDVLPPEMGEILDAPTPAPTLEISVSSEQAKQAVFQHWFERTQRGVVSESTAAARDEIFKAYDLDPTDRPVPGDWTSPARLPEAVDGILSFYLRWKNPTILHRSESGPLPDMSVGLDASLQELLGLEPGDRRLLSEVIFEDFLKDPEKQQKLLELHRIIDLFQNQYLRALAGVELQRSAHQLMQELPRLSGDGSFASLGNIPSVERMEWFVERYQEFYTLSQSAQAFAPIYQRKLRNLIAENNSKLRIPFLFGAFEFTTEDVQDFERLRKIEDDLERLETEMELLEENTFVDLDVNSRYRNNSSLREHHEERMQILEDQLLDGELSDIQFFSLSQATQNSFMHQVDARLNSWVPLWSQMEPSISGYSASFRELFERTRAEVAKDFTASVEDNRYDPADFEGRRYADPANFLPGARFKTGRWSSNGKWVMSDVYRGEMGFGMLGAGRQTPLGAVTSATEREVRSDEFARYEEVAILAETWKRIKEDGLASGINQFSLKHIVEHAVRYGEEGFYEDGMEVKKAFEWYDPILERFRQPEDDRVDFEEEVLPKYKLALYILNQGEPPGRFGILPIEYSFLLHWKKEDLLQFAFLRDQIRNFGLNEIPRNLRFIGQQELRSSPAQSVLHGRNFLHSEITPDLMNYNTFRGDPSRLRLRAEEMPAWAFERGSSESQIPRPDFDELRSLRRKLLHWQAVVRGDLGVNLLYRFKTADEVQPQLERLQEVVRRKREVAPGASFRSLGCVVGVDASGSLLPEKPEALSASEFQEAFRTRDGSLPSVEVTDLDKLLNDLSSCIARLEEKKTNLVREVEESFANQRILDAAQTARRMLNLRRALEAHIAGKEFEALPEVTAGEVSQESIWRDYLYVAVGAQAENPQLLERVIPHLQKIVSDIQDSRAEAIQISNFFLGISGSDSKNREALNALLSRIFVTPPEELNEAEQKLRLQVLEILRRRDVERLNASTNLVEASQMAIREFGVIETIRFERWSLFELDALDFISSNYGWNSVATDTAVSENFSLSLFDWVVEDLKITQREEDGVAREALRSRLSLLASSDLMESADHLALSEGVIPLIWGAKWREMFTDGAPTPLQIRNLGIDDAPQVLGFVVSHQFETLNYIWGMPATRERPLQAPDSLGRAFHLTNEGTETLRRWRVPTEDEHVRSLLSMGDRLVWDEILELYIRSLPAKEREEKRKKLRESETFPPTELTQWYFENANTSNLDGYRLSFEIANIVAERMKIDENIALTPAQRLYAANLASFVELASSESIIRTVRGYDDFLVDLFGPEDSLATRELQEALRARPRNSTQAVSAFLDLIGINSKSPMVATSLAQIQKDNKPLWEDLQKSASEFFERASELKNGPLGREDLRRISVLAAVQPEVAEAVLGISNGNVEEGSSVSRVSAKKILDLVGIEYNENDLNGIRTQLTNLRAFISHSQLLFPQFEASLASSVIRYVSLEIFKQLLGNPEFQARLRTPELQPAIETRIEKLIAYLSGAGYSLPSDSSWKDSLIRELVQAGEENSIDLDEFFHALHALLGHQEERHNFESPWSTASENAYLSRQETLKKALLESLRGQVSSMPQVQKLLLAVDQPASRLIELKEALRAAVAPAPEAAEVLGPPEPVSEEELARQAARESVRILNAERTYSEGVQNIVRLRKEAFPVSENKLELVSVYTDAASQTSEQREYLMEEMRKVYDSVLSGTLERKRREMLRALPYAEIADVKFEGEEIKIADAWHVQSRQRIFDFVRNQEAEFFDTSKRISSSQALLEEMLGKEDLEFVKAKMGVIFLGVIGQADELLSSFNRYNIQLSQIGGERLNETQLEEFHAYVFRKYELANQATQKELEALNSKESLTRAEEARRDELLNQLDFGYRAFLNLATLEEFLKRHSAREEVRTALLESPAMALQMEELQALSQHTELLFKQLIRSAGRLDGTEVRDIAFTHMIDRMEEFFLISESLENPGVSRSSVLRSLTFDDLLFGIQNKTKSELEQGYGQIRSIRAQRTRKDRWMVTNLALDIGTMFVDGLNQMGGEAYRLVLENLAVNLYSGFGVWDENFNDATQFFGELEFAGLKNWSNFSEERLKRSSDHVLADVAADSVGLFISVASFGGFSLARAGIRGAATGTSRVAHMGMNGVRATARVLPAGARQQTHAFLRNMGGRLAETRAGAVVGSASRRVSGAGRRISSFATKERHGLGYRGPASQRALSQTINSQANRFTANQSARPSATTALGRAWRTSSNAARTFGSAARAHLPPIGIRAGIDSVLIAGGSIAGVYLAFGGMDESKLWSEFGGHFGHGVQFILALSATHLLFHKIPVANRMLSTTLITYIGTDATRNITGSLMTESETFRNLVNNTLIASLEADALEVEAREYDSLGDEYWTTEGVSGVMRGLGKRLPVFEKWLELDNGEELINQWTADQERIAAAVSGGLIVGIIAGGPVVGYGLDRAAYGQMRHFEGKPSKMQRIYQALGNAYGGNPQRYYDWALKEKLSTLRIENARKPAAEQRTDEVLLQEAQELVRRNFSFIYEQINPDYQITRMARHWSAQGRPMEYLRRAAVENLRRNYSKIYEEMNAGQRIGAATTANPIWMRRIRENKLETVEEVVQRFNNAWDEGVRQGQEIRLTNFQEYVSREDLGKHLESFHRLGERLEDYLETRGRESAEASDLWKVLEEFGSRSFWESPSGQLILQEVIVPRVQAIESGLSTSPLFMGYNLRGPNAAGENLLSAADFASLIRRQAADPNAPAQRFSMQSVLEGALENTPKTDIVIFSSTDTQRPLARMYIEKGKRYLEVADRRIEIPEGIEVDVRNNGQVHLHDARTGRRAQFDQGTITDALGNWNLSSEPLPNLLSNLESTFKAQAEGRMSAAPQVVNYDVTRIDIETGKRKVTSEPVLLTRLTEKLDMISLPDNTYLIVHRGEKPVQPRRRRFFLRRRTSEEGTQQSEHVSELHLPPGWKLENVKDDVMTIRDRFGMEVELDFAKQTAEAFYRASNGQRVPMSDLKGENGEPLSLAEYRDFLREYPGVLPTEVMMVKRLQDQQPLDRQGYSSLNDQVSRLNLRDQLMAMGSQQDPSRTTRESVQSAYQQARRQQDNASREDLSTGALGRSLEQIPLPEQHAPARLLESLNRNYLERFFMDDALFQRIKSDLNYEGLAAADRAAIARSLKKDVSQLTAEDLKPFERSDLLRRAKAEDLLRYFSEGDIQTAWRLTRRVEILERSRERALGVINTWELERAQRSLGMTNKPRNLEEIQEAREQLQKEIVERFWVENAALVGEIVPKAEVVNVAIDRGLTPREQNYFALEAGKIDFVTFERAGDRLAPGVTRDAVFEGMMKQNWSFLSSQYVQLSDVLPYFRLEALTARGIGNEMRIVPEKVRALYRQLREIEEAYLKLQETELTRNP